MRWDWQSPAGRGQGEEARDKDIDGLENPALNNPEKL